MPTDTACPRCGELVTAGEPDCPYCAGRKTFPFHHREPVIIAGVVVVAIALWVATAFATRAYAARQQQLAREWFDRGESEMRAGRLPQAVTDFRTALAYSRDNADYRLRLAEALAAQGQTRQAQSHLLALWDQEPGNGTVNLELARLAAQQNDVTGALRFFHGAIYGVWQDNPAGHRREARLELIEFLLRHSARQQAQAEAIAVAEDLPRDPALMLRVAGLMREAGDYRRALQEYREVLAIVPRDPAALAGAGEAAFALRRYAEARDYLRAAVAEHTQDPQTESELATAELVLQMDPYQPRLAAAERERRIISAFSQAGQRLQQCAAARGISLDQQPAVIPLAADYASWLSLKPAITPRHLRRNPEQGDTAMDLVFRIEREAAQACGPGGPPDQALLLIAQQREEART